MITTNELVQRRQNFSKLSRTVSKVKNSLKIDQHLDLIAGLPEEDYNSFRKTFNDVFELRTGRAPARIPENAARHGYAQ